MTESLHELVGRPDYDPPPVDAFERAAWLAGCDPALGPTLADLEDGS